MRLDAICLRVPILIAALSLGAVGCDKAKDALKDAVEDAAGISKLEDDAISEMLAAAGWDETANPQLANFKIHGGIELTDKFPGDLSDEAEIPVPFDLPAQAEDAAENQRSIVLLRAETFKVDDTTEYTRFRIITVASYKPA